MADRERASLAALLPEDLELARHSTHVSVSVPTEVASRVGHVVARTFASDLIRLVDSPDRCGIWIRPRHERLELCVDFVDGARLAAMVLFAVAAVRFAAEESAGVFHALAPRQVRMAAGQSEHRPGWRLDRRAFVGGDPFAAGGGAPLRLLTGGSIPAADHLAEVWRAIRPIATAHSWPRELAILDELIAHGRLPETSPESGPGWSATATAFGDALRPRARPTFDVAVVALTWAFAVFLVLASRGSGSRRVFAAVPRDQLGAFLGLLDAGDLDGLLNAYIRLRSSRRVLAGFDQASRAGLYDAIGPRRALLPVAPVWPAPGSAA